MEINKILRWVVIIGLWLVPFLPLLVFYNSFFPFITGKNFVFRLIVEVILASWLILAFRDRSYLPKKSYFLWAVLGLLVVTTLATIFGENPYRSFWSNYERMGGLVSLLHVGAYFFVLASILKKRIDWFYFALVNLVVNWVIIIYGLLQLAGKLDIHQGGVRLDATLGNAAYLAVYLLLNLFIYAFLFSKTKGWAWRSLFGATVFFDFILLYYTATRGALLGLIGGIIFSALLFLIFNPKPKAKKIAGGILIGLVILGGLFWSIRGADFVKNSQVLSRFANISLTETTTQSRLLVWKMSWEGFKEHPVLGWGPENYSLVFSKYYDPLMWRQEPWFDRSHNIFLDWVIDAGVLGLLAYLSLFALAFYYLWRDRLKLGNGAYILAGLLGAYLFQNIFVFDNLISYILFFSLLAYLHFNATEEGSGPSPDFKQVKDYKMNGKSSVENNYIFNVVVPVIVVIGLGAGLYYFNYLPYRVSRLMIKAINPQISNPEQSLLVFQNIFEAKTFGSGEAREQLVTKTYGVLSDSKISNDLKVSYLKLIDEQKTAHLSLFAEDARSNLLFGSFYSLIGRFDEGAALLKKANELSPKKQQILIELAVSYTRQQNASKALEAARQAFELDQNYPEARKVYALIALMTAQRTLAESLITPIKNDSSYYDDERFANIYVQLGYQDLLQEINSLREKNKK